MTRSLYRAIVWMHPPMFRREFAGEMLWIYDESAEAGEVAGLFVDGCASLARQWLLRSGYWKLAAALAGGAAQVSIVAAVMLQFAEHRIHAAIPVDQNPDLAALMRLSAITAVGLLAAVMFLVFFWRRLARRSEVLCSSFGTSPSGTPPRRR